MKLKGFVILLSVFICFGCQQPVKKTTVTALKTQEPESNYSLKQVNPFTFQFPNEKRPVVFYFDAQAAGLQFVRNYGDMFKDMGLGIVASNRFRNGISGNESGQIVQQMIQLARENNCDMEQIYLMGFSGGGRFIQQLGNMLPHVKGIITFGIGKNMKAESGVPEINIIGIEDLNFSEAMQYPLSGNYKVGDLVLLHKGGHEWPPVKIIRYSLTRYYKGDNKNNVEMPKPDDELVNKLNVLLQRKGLKNDKTFHNELLSIIEEQLKNEQKWRAYLQPKIQVQDVKVWNALLNEINRKEASKYVKARLMGYMSMVNYIISLQYIQKGSYENAQKQLEIYELVDPFNPDIKILEAMLLAKQGKLGKAVEKIDGAIDNGFDNYQKLFYANFPDDLTKSEDFVLTLKKIYPEKH